MQLLVLAASVLLAAPAAAHGGVISYSIEGKKYQGYGVKSLQAQNRFTTIPPAGGSIQRAWAEIRPVNDPTSGHLACNTPGSAARMSAPVTAGASVTAFWNSDKQGNPWPHAGGPMTVYMAKCPGDCASFGNPASAEWFKIHQEGLVSGTIGKGQWGTNKMMKDGFSLTVKIPATLEPGNYLIRHETINLARAPAEMYPECAQLKVTGSGTAKPSKEFLFKLPGAYRKTDAAIKYSMHDAAVANSKEYVIPGPPVWTG